MRRLFIMRKDLHMSPGKLAAQVAHCAEAYWTQKIMDGVLSAGIYGVSADVSLALDEYRNYLCDIHTKTICEAKNKSHLLKAQNMAVEMGLVEGTDFDLIYDKCLTEITPEEEDGTTLTGIWFKPLQDEQARQISKKYQLYK